MNITKIRKNLESNKGKLIHFKYNGARNQIEEFDGIIEDTYNAIFTIRLDNIIKYLHKVVYFRGRILKWKLHL